MRIHPSITKNTAQFTSWLWLIHETFPILSTYSMTGSSFLFILVNLKNCNNSRKIWNATWGQDFWINKNEKIIKLKARMEIPGHWKKSKSVLFNINISPETFTYQPEYTYLRFK